MHTKLYTLDELKKKLAKVDETIIDVIARRMFLAQQVESYKRKIGQPVIRKEVENQRVKQAGEWADKRKLNPLFAMAIMYEIINESCKVQLEQLQSNKIDILSENLDTNGEWYVALKDNLLKFTKIVANIYDEKYSTAASFPVASYRRFEHSVLKKILSKLPSKTLALDLGCATGLMSFKLAKDFAQVKGFDISPDMIIAAETKKNYSAFKNVSFAIADIENGLPDIPNETVSLVVLNQGTASDIRDIKKILKETVRILRPGGRVFLSFYNTNALLYNFAFIPWGINLNAEINFKAKCLEVHLAGQEPFVIYAKGYNFEQISELFANQLAMEEVYSYPTISTILPEHLLDNKEIQASMEKIDNTLADLYFGSYLIAVGIKL